MAAAAAALPTSRRPFTWERAPWSRCAACGEETFGFLSGGGDSMSWRCTTCRHRVDEPLPEVDKKVIYIDQFAFSNLLLLKLGIRPRDKLSEFWEELDRLLRRTVLLQRAILPHSNVHHAETIVSRRPKELRETYEGLGGDVRFVDTRDVQMAQIGAYLEAFLEGKELTSAPSVDDVLASERNQWLPNIRVSVDADYSLFAEQTRRSRRKVGESVRDLMATWRETGVGFREVLETELNAYRVSRAQALIEFRANFELAAERDDVLAMLDLNESHIGQELTLLEHKFTRAGVPEASHALARDSFWSWEGNAEMPFGRVLAYMFAALAGQVRAGRTSVPSDGFMKDVETIAAYGPSVDAMFIDKECATLLTNGRPGKELGLKARIFSLANRGDLLNYLRELEADADAQTRKCARIMYGVE